MARTTTRAEAVARDHTVDDRAIHCAIAGTTVRIEGLPAVPRRRIASLLQAFASPEPAADPMLRLRVKRQKGGNWTLIVNDEETPAACGLFACLLPHVEVQAIRYAVAATDAAVFHGGALTRGASTVLLLGPSGAGKTTLTLGLVGRGWMPYTDDAAMVDVASLTLRAFPRCFHVLPWSLSVLPAAPELKWIEGMSGFARPLSWANDIRRPTAIIVVERDTARPSALNPITQGEAAGALLGESMPTALPKSRLAATSARLAAQVRQCLQLNNNDLAEALDLIEGACPP
jgi:hypothetical protein